MRSTPNLLQDSVRRASDWIIVLSSLHGEADVQRFRHYLAKFSSHISNDSDSVVFNLGDGDVMDIVNACRATSTDADSKAIHCLFAAAGMLFVCTVSLSLIIKQIRNLESNGLFRSEGNSLKREVNLSSESSNFTKDVSVICCALCVPLDSARNAVSSSGSLVDATCRIAWVLYCFVNHEGSRSTFFGYAWLSEHAFEPETRAGTHYVSFCCRSVQ